MSLDPIGMGRKRWTMCWKELLHAFQVAFEGRLTPTPTDQLNKQDQPVSGHSPSMTKRTEGGAWPSLEDVVDHVSEPVVPPGHRRMAVSVSVGVPR
jgi:hypothetical protein